MRRAIDVRSFGKRWSISSFRPSSTEIERQKPINDLVLTIGEDTGMRIQILHERESCRARTDHVDRQIWPVLAQNEIPPSMKARSTASETLPPPS
jgi:hypothetical protein